MGNLGNAYFQLGEPLLAIEFYEQHLDIAHKIGDIFGAALTSFNFAIILKNEQPTKALIYVLYAWEVFKQVGNQQYTLMAQKLINSIQSN